MKMEVDVEAEDDGVITQILCKEGENIKAGDILAIIKKAEK
jgi:biotin carboxyl carrier protein